MNKDRAKICKIISEMLNNPDWYGIFPISTAYTRLKHHIDGVRAEAIGWTHANTCVCLDNGGDPRTQNVPEMLFRTQARGLEYEC